MNWEAEMNDPCPNCGVIDYEDECGFCRLSKENAILRNGYNSICDDIYLGEHIDHEWIKQSILDAASGHFMDVLNRKIKDQTKMMDVLKAALIEASEVIAEMNELWEDSLSGEYEADCFTAQPCTEWQVKHKELINSLKEEK